MLNVVFVIYRKWSYDIYKNILNFQNQRKDFSVTVLITSKDKEFRIPRDNKIKVIQIDPKNSINLRDILHLHNISIVFFYGWSWIIKPEIIDNFLCICLHPSLLPMYRGGSPIQHQIINNEKFSGVTLFKMEHGIDNGPIYDQATISLLGNISDIINRIIDVGTLLTKQFLIDYLNNDYSFMPQKNINKYPPLKRRNPTQSELTPEQVKTMSFQELENIVRCLTDPYPNAYIQFENKAFLIQEVQKYNKIPHQKYLINSKNLYYKNNLYLQVNNGSAKIIKYKIHKLTGG